MAIIKVNGKTIRVNGSNISIRNDVVMADGKVVSDGEVSGVVEIQVEGDLVTLDTDCSATVNGEVHGNVSAGNSVHAGDVKGSVRAGNSVHCGSVGGDIHAGNSVKHR